MSHANHQSFRDFITDTFTTWRPSLAAIFKDVFSRRQLKRISRDLCIDLEVTPTTLRFEQWLRLFACYRVNSNPLTRCAVVGSEKRLRRQQERLQKIPRTR